MFKLLIHEFCRSFYYFLFPVSLFCFDRVRHCCPFSFFFFFLFFPQIYKLYLILQFMFFCCSPLCIFGWNEAKVFWDYVCFETFPNKNNVVGKSSFIPGCFSQPDGVICYFMAQMTS